MKDKKIAVVILNWNGAKLLEQFLPSVISFSDEAQIYVADNASKDESIAALKTKFPSVKIIQNKANYGFAKGYNEALQHVEEEYYALVNSDIEVTQNWLTPILSIFENQPEIGIIQPKILDFKNKEYFEYASAAGGFIEKYCLTPESRFPERSVCAPISSGLKGRARRCLRSLLLRRPSEASLGR